MHQTIGRSPIGEYPAPDPSRSSYYVSDALYRDLLIGVTSFFRDEQTFEGLQHTVISRLFDGKGPGTMIRIWVPGCATGEEAYSIAILVKEAMVKAGSCAEGPDLRDRPR